MIGSRYCPHSIPFTGTTIITYYNYYTSPSFENRSRSSSAVIRCCFLSIPLGLGIWTTLYQKDHSNPFGSCVTRSSSKGKQIQTQMRRNKGVRSSSSEVGLTWNYKKGREQKHSKAMQSSSYDSVKKLVREVVLHENEFHAKQQRCRNILQRVGRTWQTEMNK